MADSIIDLDNFYEKVRREPRLLMDIELKPIQGDRFQPTGFPDIGAAVYQRPDGTRMVLVESAQSMANRLESTILSDNRIDIIDDLKGIPYVRSEINVEGRTIFTSSLVEAHRLASPFIVKDKGFIEKFKSEAGINKDAPLDWKIINKTIFKYDPNSLIHGVFISNVEGGRVKAPRILTAFIEAEGITEVESGGVKNDFISPSGNIRIEERGKAEKNKGSQEGYGNVPYHRTEYNAKKITAYFNIDISLIEGSGLDESGKKLLFFMSLYKIMRFLNDDMRLRLRTACDLRKVGGLHIDNISEVSDLPNLDSLKNKIRGLIEDCKREKLFADPPTTILTLKGKIEQSKGNDGKVDKDEERDDVSNEEESDD
jgi:CRISPR-associated protein Csb1